MIKSAQRRIQRFIAGIVLTFFTVWTVLPGPVYAQPVPTRASGGVFYFPAPSAMIPLSEGFSPVILKGIKIYPANPLQFDFIVDTGDAGLKSNAFKNESQKIIKYFLASLTVSEEDLWVDLSPYEKDRIIPNKFGITEMGRDLLAQDYLLKQLTASLIHPETDLGKKFWERVRQKAREQFGTTEIPVNTFNKVWVVPDKTKVYKTGTSAFVTEARLRVMLEEDYIATNSSWEGRAREPRRNTAGSPSPPREGK